MSLKKACIKARQQGIKNPKVCMEERGELNLKVAKGSRSTSVCGKCP